MRECSVEYKPGLPEPGAEYPIDLERIGNVVAKTVRGLLWSETRFHLSEYCGIAVVPSFNFDFLGPRNMALIAEVEARELLSSRERKSIGDGVCEYWWERRFSEQRPDSAWVLRFYQGIYFVCFVMPMKEIAKKLFRWSWEGGLIAVSGNRIFVPALDI